jgi:hypothetical protein
MRFQAALLGCDIFLAGWEGLDRSVARLLKVRPEGRPREIPSSPSYNLLVRSCHEILVTKSEFGIRETGISHKFEQF